MAILTFFLARHLGAVEQGLFFSAKSSYDLIVTCFVFGFPQSIILEINLRKASRRSLYNHTISYSLVVFVVLGIALVLWQPVFADSFADALLISCSVSLIVTAYLWRAIFITVNDGLRYSVVTTTPTLFLALSCFSFVVIFANVSLYTNEIFFYCAAGTICATYLLARPGESFLKKGDRPSHKTLVITGLDAFLLSLSTAGQIFLTYQYLKECADSTTMGFFSLALAASNILAFPLQALSPVLLNRWSVQGQASTQRDFSLPLNSWIKVTAAIGGICIIAILTPTAILIIAGNEYRGAFSMIQLMVIYTAVTLVQRIAALRIAASGNIRFGSGVAIGRGAFVAVALYMLAQHRDLSRQAGVVACIVWLIAEILATVMTLRKVGMNGTKK